MKTLLSALIFLSVTSLAQADLKQDLIQAHGFDQFQKVEEIQFAFKAKVAVLHINRYWKWNPQTNVVALLNEDGEVKVQYDRDDLATLGNTEKDTEKDFINDSFWLAWPLHLSWNDQVQVRDLGKKTDPYSKTERRCIELDYSTTEGGFTPGDRYELYFDEGDLKPESWAYFPAGKKDPKVVCSWENYTTIDGLSFSQTHESNGMLSIKIEGLQIKTISAE